jgi:putative GTP pyrophosphokinase
VGKFENVGDLVEQLYRERKRQWNTAMTAVENLLTDEFASVLQGEDPTRLSLERSRIKDQARALEKIKRKVDDQSVVRTPKTCDEVRALVTDIVGVKVLCKTLQDSDSLVEHLQTLFESGRSGIRLAEPITDYVAKPKSSGYRARHVLILVDVPGSTSSEIVEVQIKTRLQDAWGELTHEDLYKGPLAESQHHRDLASTMAGLLWEVDKLADLIARNTDAQLAPTKEQTMAAASTPTHDFRALVTHTGPRYALAEGPDGRRGLIPAVVIRDLVAPGDHIDVDDYLEVGDELDVQSVETKDGYFLHPTDPSQLAR